MADLVSVDFPLRLPEQRGEYLRFLDPSLGAPDAERVVWQYGEEASATSLLDDEIQRRVRQAVGPPASSWAEPGTCWLEIELRPQVFLPPALVSLASVVGLFDAGIGVCVSIGPDPEGVAPTEPGETGYSSDLGGDEFGAPGGLPAEWPSGLAATIAEANDSGRLLKTSGSLTYYVTQAPGASLVEGVVLDDLLPTLDPLLGEAADGESTRAPVVVLYVPSDHEDIWLDGDMLGLLVAHRCALAIEVTPGEPHASYIAAFNAQLLKPHADSPAREV